MRNPANSDTLDETEIVHLGKSFQNECSLFIHTGKKSHKTLWELGACKYVISLESYQTVPNKSKTELFPSSIRIKAANGSIIHNNCECDITFRMASEKFTFPFLCSGQLSQSVILGHNFCNTFNFGTVWTAPDIMSLTYEGQPIAQCTKT